MSTTDFRVESDSMGQVNVPSSKLWGAQTQRSIEYFSIGQELMPIEVIHALATIKKAAAITNNQLGYLDDTKKQLIVDACDAVLSGTHDDEFPLHVWMTGSGTQSNMNVNEVISNIANQTAGSTLGSKIPIHPNDHVNMSQSSNDTFPTAMHIATAIAITYNLLPAIKYLHNELLKKVSAWANIVKIGRTHMQDAVPITLGQEFSG